MSTRNQQTIRIALLFSAIAAAVAFGAWLPGAVGSHEKERGEVFVPNRAKEDPRLNEVIQTLLRARYEEVAKEAQEVDRVLVCDEFHIPGILEVYRRLLCAVLELTAEPELRAELLDSVLNRAKQLEELCEKRLRPKLVLVPQPLPRTLSPVEMFPVRAFRMEVQIEILRAKRAQAASR